MLIMLLTHSMLTLLMCTATHSLEAFTCCNFLTTDILVLLACIVYLHRLVTTEAERLFGAEQHSKYISDYTARKSLIGNGQLQHVVPNYQLLSDFLRGKERPTQDYEKKYMSVLYGKDA